MERLAKTHYTATKRHTDFSSKNTTSMKKLDICKWKEIKKKKKSKELKENKKINH